MMKKKKEKSNEPAMTEERAHRSQQFKRSYYKFE